MGLLAQIKYNPIKNFLIKKFIKKFAVNMQDAIIEDPFAYANFNDFFTRQLKPSVRPICKEQNTIASPADGFCSTFGNIDNGRLLQAKGINYSIYSLLGRNEIWADYFQQGNYATIYLSPKDYHRVHQPIDGKLLEMHYYPGYLLSVNPTVVANNPSLFAQNERVIAYFQTDFGVIAVIFVGAVGVGSIVTTWAGAINPNKNQGKLIIKYNDGSFFAKGEEIGYFKIGSTVILLMPKNNIEWDEKLNSVDAPVKMGEQLGVFKE